MFPKRSWKIVFVMYSMNILADNTHGFRKGMSWENIEEIIQELFYQEYNTPENKN